MSESVVVVGASAAGLFTAWQLALNGSSVHVLEGADRLPQSDRTLIVTSRLRSLLGATCETAIVNRIRQYELFTDGHAATVPLNEPDLVVERSALIRKLAEAAEAAGVRMTLGRRFVDLVPRKMSVVLRVRDSRGHFEEHDTRVVVGADGAFSRVAAAGGWPKQLTAPVVQAIVRLPSETCAETSKVWFVPADTPYFYWLIPESPARAALGLIGEDASDARRCLDRFIQSKGYEPLSFQGARIPVYAQWTPVHRRIGGADAYLVGDAAGHVKVTTVGGIVTGFRGAAAVVDAIATGRYKRIRALRRELDVHLLIRKALHHFDQTDYSRLVASLTPSMVRTLSRHTRDEAPGLIMRLCLTQPRLLFSGAGGLLRNGSFPTHAT